MLPWWDRGTPPEVDPKAGRSSDLQCGSCVREHSCWAFPGAGAPTSCSRKRAPEQRPKQASSVAHIWGGGLQVLFIHQVPSSCVPGHSWLHFRVVNVPMTTRPPPRPLGLMRWAPALMVVKGCPHPGPEPLPHPMGGHSLAEGVTSSQAFRAGKLPKTPLGGLTGSLLELRC